MRAPVRTTAGPPELKSTTSWRHASHVVAAAVLLNSVLAIGTFLGVIVQPLHRLGGRGAGFGPMIVVATLAAVPLPASLSRAGHSAVADIFLGNDGHGAAFAVKHRLGCQSHPPIARRLAVLDHEQVPGR